MVTIKLPYTIDNQDFFDSLKELRRQQTIIYNLAFNRYQDDFNEQQVRTFIKPITTLNSWFKASATKDAQATFTIKGKSKTVFGGKHNLTQYLKKKITKEEYKANKLRPLYSIGEANKNGNRFFIVDNLNHKVTFKPKCGQKFILTLPKLSKKYKEQLRLLEEAATNKTKPITFSLTDKHICITYEEFKSTNVSALNQDRVIAIDLNPNRIGYSVVDHKTNKVLEAACIDFELLNKSLGYSSEHKKSKAQTNKRHFELYQIVKFLINKAVHYKCSQFIVEDLSIQSKDHLKGAKFNRLVNNCWNRQRVIQSIKKNCFIFGITLKEVNPAYSSIIGNIIHTTYPDPINASLELNRKGYNKFQSGKFYPGIPSISLLNEQWKQTLTSGFESWKELSDWIKKSKIKYRLSFEDFPHKVFEFSSVKSNCFIKELEYISSMKQFKLEEVS